MEYMKDNKKDGHGPSFLQIYVNGDDLRDHVRDHDPALQAVVPVWLPLPL